MILNDKSPSSPKPPVPTGISLNKIKEKSTKIIIFYVLSNK